MLVMGATNRPQELDEAVLRYLMERHNHLTSKVPQSPLQRPLFYPLTHTFTHQWVAGAMQGTASPTGSLSCPFKHKMNKHKQYNEQIDMPFVEHLLTHIDTLLPNKDANPI